MKNWSWPVETSAAAETPAAKLNCSSIETELDATENA